MFLQHCVIVLCPKPNRLFTFMTRGGGHLLCSFLMSLKKNYFVVSVYPRTVCKCQVKKGYDLVNAKFSQFDITL